MKTIIKIAWRNVWRNKLRSSVVILSIVLGIWSGLFIMAMTLGLNEQRMSGSVNSYLSHIQIHHPKFLDDYNKKLTIDNSKEILEEIRNTEGVKAAAERIVVTGMASTSSGSSGIQILGIVPEHEAQLTTISSSLVEGTYFTKFKKNPIVIGKKLADKLGLKIKSKLVLNVQDLDNNVINVSFRVEGIFKSNSSMFDQMNVFVRLSDIEKITELTGKIHEISLTCNTIEEVEQVKTTLMPLVGTNLIESWDEIAPELGYAQETMGTFIYIFMGIILMALAFGIINTMLMAVLERKRELGMMMSIGMNKTKLFLMIMFETIFLVLIATPIGMLLSYYFITRYGEIGIDLSAVAQGLESLGIGSRIFTYLPAELYVNITLLTIFIAFLSSLIPARRALKLNPAESVREI